MPRPKTPLAIADLKGQTRKNPQRYRDRANAPQPQHGVGEPPQWLTNEAASAWVEISSSLPLGVLTIADRVAVEVASTLIAEFRASPKDFTAARLAQLRGLLGSLGLTPADRIKLAVPETLNQDDPWLALSRACTTD